MPRRLKVDRSALVREALRAHPAGLTRRERVDRAGYEGQPDRGEADAVWEKVAAWPEAMEAAGNRQA